MVKLELKDLNKGSVFIGGAVIQWIRDNMNFCRESSETEQMAASLDKEDEVVFVPAFVGLGAPYWDMDARGAIFGLTRDTTKEQIVRAAIKSIALQSKDLIDAYEEDSDKGINELKVDGGATANSFLMQYQADILKIPILLPEITESTALGAAYLAGLTVNLYKSVDEIAENNKIIKRFIPEMDDSVRNKELKIWKDSVRRLL